MQLSPMLWDKVPLWLLPYGEYLSGKNSRAHLVNKYAACIYADTFPFRLGVDNYIWW